MTAALPRAIPWWIIGFVGGAMQALLWLISEPAYLFSDFYKAYYPAAKLLLVEGPRAWYIADPSNLGFVNVPILAYPFVPLALLSPETAGWVFLGLGIGACLATLVLLARLVPLDRRSVAVLLLLFTANGPLVNSLREGNTTHFVMLFLVVALTLWRAGWPFAAGLILGLCAIFKLPLLLFGPFYVLRLRWRIAAGIASAVGVVLLLSLAVFGHQINLDWYKACVEPYLGGVVGAFNVQSIDGFLLRLTTGESRLWDWDPLQPPVFHRVVRTIILGGMFGATLWLLRRSDRAQASFETSALTPLDILEFVLVLNLALVTSPLSWTHYYLLLLLPWALHLGGKLPLPRDTVTRWLMRGGLVFASMPVIIPEIESDWLVDLVARTIVSVWLFGGLLILTALLRGIWYLAPARQAPGVST
jgi:hypothetical protein